MLLYLGTWAGTSPHMKVRGSNFHFWGCWHPILWEHCANVVFDHMGRRRPIYESSGLELPFLEVLAPYMGVLCKCFCNRANGPCLVDPGPGLVEPG